MSSVIKSQTDFYKCLAFSKTNGDIPPLPSHRLDISNSFDVINYINMIAVIECLLSRRQPDLLAFITKATRTFFVLLTVLFLRNISEYLVTYLS